MCLWCVFWRFSALTGLENNPTIAPLKQQLETITEVVALRYTTNIAQSIGTGMQTTVIFPTMVFNTHPSSFVNSTTFVCPKSGLYWFDSAVSGCHGCAEMTRLSIALFLNDTLYTVLDTDIWDEGGREWRMIRGSAIAMAQIGDRFTIRASFPSSLAGGNDHNYLQINRLG